MLARDPDLVFLANGPGDPAALDYVVDTVRELVGKQPVVGICLGHQLLCRAVGLETFKLPFGHRGANHPVKDLATGRIEITSQNHGFAVRRPDGGETIEADEPVRWETDFGAAELSHLNLYDRTVEGLVLRDVAGCTVQYHPEAGPGPHDARHLFDRFLELAAMSADPQSSAESVGRYEALGREDDARGRSTTPVEGLDATAESRVRSRSSTGVEGRSDHGRRVVMLDVSSPTTSALGRYLAVAEHDGSRSAGRLIRAWRIGRRPRGEAAMLGTRFETLGAARGRRRRASARGSSERLGATSTISGLRCRLRGPPTRLCASPTTTGDRRRPGAPRRRQPAMPRRDDIHKILLIGSGPIVIGQAAEFDYSGVQACKVLLEEGYEVVLVNSNPATIMTDPEFADRTYVEPLLPGVRRAGSSSASAPTRCCRRSAARRRSTSRRRCTTTARSSASGSS